VESLLDEALGDSEWLRDDTRAREAVRLLLNLARVCVEWTPDEDEEKALIAFAAGLEDS